MLKITIINQKSQARKDYKFTQNTILIGRQQNCDIILDATGVSRRHAKISVTKNLVEIEDLESGNGTLVNKIKIAPKEKTLLKTDDVIRIEEFEIHFSLDGAEELTYKSPAPNTRTADQDIIEIKMIKKVLGALDQDKLPSIVLVGPEFKNKKAVLEDGQEQLVIGRDHECELAIDSGIVSRRHAVLSIKWGGYVLTDLQSKNGTYVNGEKIEEKTLKDGDEIIFGTIKALFKNPQEFDIAAISQSIQEEKQKSSMFEQTSAFNKGEIKKEDSVSEAAKISAKATEDKEKPKQESTKEEKTKVPLEQEPSKDKTKENKKEERKPEQKTEKKGSQDKKQKKGTFSSFSTTEFILFGFGILVILIILIVLAILFI